VGAEEVYGRRPHRLPTFARSAVERAEPGFRVLSFEEDRELAARSLGTFTATFGGQISWDGVSGVSYADYQDEAEEAEVLRRLLSEYLDVSDEIVVFWSSLDVPTLVLPARAAAEHAPEIAAVTGDFSIYNPRSGYFAEFRADGDVRWRVIPDPGDSGG
jgi:hypothetical protein